MFCRLNIRPVINKSLDRVYGYTTRKSLHATANDDGSGPGKNTTNEPVDVKVHSVLTLNFLAVLPGNTFWAGLKFVIASSQPSVLLNAVFEEVQIFCFLLVGWHRRNARFENSVKNAIVFSHLLVICLVIDSSRLAIILSVVKRRGHVYFSIILL